jgi:TPR repeat protein
MSREEVESFQTNIHPAEQGDRIAQCNIGVLYEAGIGVPQDFKKAANWYRKSAEQGY